MRWIGRLLGSGIALILVLAGGVALGIGYLPENPLVFVGSRLVELSAAGLASGAGLSDDFPARVQGFMSSALARFALAPLGLVFLVTVWLPGKRTAAPVEAEEDERAFAEPLQLDKRLRKKLLKQGKDLARQGSPLEAAEYYFANSLLEEAAEYFVKGEEYVRAAEIRHDQNRFIEAAELYLKAGRLDAAGSIFGQQGEFTRAAEAYLEAGNSSVAAEMFERGEDFRRAADCYAQAGFPRHAAQNYVKCESWQKAARCLEETILEESAGSGGTDERKAAELKKLVHMAGKLYERCGKDEAAQAILVKGECYAEAAEIAERGERFETAAELYTRAKIPNSAAEMLRRLGRDDEAARILADYHRDQGDDAAAAAQFEAAEDWLAAGDLYRLLEDYARSGECYERQGDSRQAAEMFQMAGDRKRAAEAHERAGNFAQAAECFALEGDTTREAELLERAGQLLEAGELYIRNERQDDAIRALQQIDSEHADFASAAALLGELFRQRDMLPLAITKLEQATQGLQLVPDNAQVFYALASAYEADDDKARALELYEKILALDYHHADVAERVPKLREQVEQASPPEPATGATPLSASAEEGRYKVVGKLGKGGMGVVYKAQDAVLDRTVAFKVLPDTLKENPQALKNFLREAKSAARLNHPNIVTVYDAGEQNGVFYIAMEYVDGKTLKDLVRQRGKIPPQAVIHVLAQMAEALAYAHEKKVVHRDIKSANAMWTRDRKAKIMDFGLAKVVEEVRNQTTVISGTPYYMSPEQTLGRNVDHRTDIYSLGVTAFEMATGVLPFREGNLPYHHVHTPPPNPRDFEAELPDVIVQLIERCLRKKPEERYQSARDLLAELKA